MSFLRLATAIKEIMKKTVQTCFLFLSVAAVANAETGLVVDIGNGLISSSPRQFVNAGGYVVYEALDPQGALDGIWRSDGTEAGTIELENFGRFNILYIQRS